MQERRTAPNAAHLSQETYRQLRDAIVRGEIRPNERLVETELAERLQMSRTPVREGLQRLASEGLIVSRRRGWVVREHSAAEIREIYEARTALEGYAARLAAERGSDAQIAEIRKLHDEGDEDISPSAREHLVDVNDAFHESIAAAAGNETLTEMIRRSRKHFFNYRVAELYTEQEAASSVAGHGEIVDALVRRDGAAAEDAMRRHVAEALVSTLARYR
jgi:DNA-binding GntR family transcriptional regulator